jgi:hypothetical protein
MDAKALARENRRGLRISLIRNRVTIKLNEINGRHSQMTISSQTRCDNSEVAVRLG